MKKIFVIALVLFLPAFILFAASVGIIDPGNLGNKYAKILAGPYAGTQINFKPTGGSQIVEVHNDRVRGYAWGEATGYIVLSCEDTTSGCVPANGSFKVTNDGAGNLAGYAWGSNTGWISFSCTNPTSSCSGSAGSWGVKINSSGEFVGHAWSQNFGYIQFDCGTVAASGRACPAARGDRRLRVGAMLLDWRHELIVDIPGEIDPLVLIELFDAQIDHLASLRLGVEGRKVGLGQQLADDAGGVAGIDQVVDQQKTFAIVLDAFEDPDLLALGLRRVVVGRLIARSADRIDQTDFQLAGNQRRRNQAATRDRDDALERPLLQQLMAEQTRVAMQLRPRDHDIVTVRAGRRVFHGAFPKKKLIVAIGRGRPKSGLRAWQGLLPRRAHDAGRTRGDGGSGAGVRTDSNAPLAEIENRPRRRSSVGPTKRSPQWNERRRGRRAHG